MSPFPDIPTALTRAESEAIEELANDCFVLEAGALLGYSTVVMARVAAHVVSVDPHDDYPAADPRPTFDQYQDNIERFDVEFRVTTVLTTLDKALPFLIPDYFDFVFLDLSGEYEDTIRAMRGVEHWLTGGLVALAVHDCGHPDWPGVSAAVSEFAGATGIEPGIVDRLAIFIPA
jgi:Methyltransferase domain